MILALLIELMPQVLPFIFALFVGYLIYNDVQVHKIFNQCSFSTCVAARKVGTIIV